MDKKVLYALTTKIFSALKKLGIKPKLGVTTDIQRLPGLNSFNSDLSTLTQARPESLKKLITTDADFLAKANPDELRQYYNNLEYVQSNFPEIFSKAEVVTESKTGLKTLVDDGGERIKKPTKEDYEDYGEILNDSENTVVQGTETFDELEALVKKQKDYEASMYQEYKMGRLDPSPGDKSEGRMKFLRKKAEEAEMTGDRRLISSDEMDELSDLESTYLKDIDTAYGTDTAVKKEMKKAIEEGTLKTNRMTEFGLDPSKSKDYDKFLEMESIKQKYGNMVDDNLLKQIMIDDNPQRKAEVLASIDEAMKMQEKGMSTQEIIDIMKNTTRTKQAKGGLIKSVSYKSMFGDLDKTLGKGLGTMFKKKRR
jgi:hypothetical protein